MLHIYNSLTKSKVPFTPMQPGCIKIYVCGITTYDYCHIGHARAFVAFDVIVRYLRARGWAVTYIRNITDIDDKIIKRAQENNETVEALTARFTNYMHEDFKILGILPPDKEPCATQHMPKMIEMIQKLKAKGAAYVSTNGDLYYDVSKYDKYGELAHKDLETLLSGARIEVSEAKQNPLDFVLWKMAKPGEPSWPSPWGAGRPGWHIECSAMSTTYLGDSFDIHGGGADLMFPHHENERAQAEKATGKTFANTWMHVGFVQINKEKMSKSLNNFFTIRQVLEEYDPEVIRYFLLASHYRSPVNYSKDQLDNAKQALDRLYTALRGVDAVAFNSHEVKSSPFSQRFYAAMDDDFNTPEALGVIFDLARELNTLKLSNDKQAPHSAMVLKYLTSVLGVVLRDPEDYFQEGLPQDEKTITTLIAKRNEARKNRDWKSADAARNQLDEMGIVLEDTPEGTLWRRR
ncbi:MAG TPA: cysteine--tRNA ligase [Gammaproteobacteria bacterium]|nr:cysteine--tRNA ligase [Gammaproteobacteria bacterium]